MRAPEAVTSERWYLTGPTEDRTGPTQSLPPPAPSGLRPSTAAALVLMLGPVTPAALHRTTYSVTPEGHELATVPDAVAPSLGVTVPEWRLGLLLASPGGCPWAQH